MPRRPPRRPDKANAIGAPSTGHDPTDRAIEEVREQVDRMRQGAIAPRVTMLTLAALLPLPQVDASVYADPRTGELFWRSPDGEVSQLSNQSGGGGGGDTYGDREHVFCLRNFGVTSGTAVIDAGAIQVTTTAGSATVVWGPLPIRLGERLKSVRIRTLKGSSGTMTVRAITSVNGGGASHVATAATSVAVGLQTITSTVAAPAAVVANENFYVQVTSNDIGDVVSQVAFTVDKVT
jgi:hypothetical protein